MSPEKAPNSAKPFLIRNQPHEAAGAARATSAANPARRRVLGAIEPAARVAGRDLDGPRQLVIPLEPTTLVGVDRSTIRVFRVGARQALEPLPESGYNPGLGAAWATITETGTYVAAGMPRDRLLQHLVGRLAKLRTDTTSVDEKGRGLLREAFAPILESEPAEIEIVRRMLLTLEMQTAALPPYARDLERGHGRHATAIRLPGGLTLEAMRDHVRDLPPDTVLAEEAIAVLLGFDRAEGPPWETRADAGPPWRWRAAPHFIKELPPGWWHRWCWPFCWLYPPDWWMYHANDQHSGVGICSSLNSSNAASLAALATLILPGPMVSVPTVVDGQIYVGTGGSDRALYKIDLVSNVIQGRFPTYGDSAYGEVQGIGGSPAVVSGKVYFTSLGGWVCCVDIASMSTADPPPPAVWITDLKGNWLNTAPFSAMSQNQPIQNPMGDTWSGPLVVNGRVYVGSGEGESGALGFVWCLDATTGRVIWVFCTNQFTAGVANQPNHVPSSVVPAGLPGWASAFMVFNEPVGGLAHKGASVWSSCAYDSVNDRVWVGTGNSSRGAPAGIGPNDPTDYPYGSGVLSLDASSGNLIGYFIPPNSDSYRPGDEDIDVPGSPTVYDIGGQRRIGIGSKSGAYWTFDGADPGPVLTPVGRRNLLPVDANTGMPLLDVDSWGGENLSGTFTTAAVDSANGRLFIGLGGYDSGGYNIPTTPFMRAIHWDTLDDAWAVCKDAVPNSGGGIDEVLRYMGPMPPMYQATAGAAAGLSSPAVANDVVFVATCSYLSPTNIWAFRTTDGYSVWSAPDLTGVTDWCLGVSIYGDYVVAAVGSTLHRYRLSPTWPPWWWKYIVNELTFPPLPWPPPPPWQPGLVEAG